MVLDAVSNFVRGNTDAAVGTDDTTVSVADASIFPDPETDGEFNVVIWDANNFPRPDQDADVEILRVTERDTTADELTVTRGQEMTSAANHPEGSAIHLSPTAKMFSDIESTFGDFWDAGSQELTADVNNTNTTTQALEAESASVGQLSNGVAGDGNEISSIWGNTGEYVLVASRSYDGSTTVTSSDYEALIPNENRLIAFNEEALLRTNWESWGFSFNFRTTGSSEGNVRLVDIISGESIVEESGISGSQTIISDIGDFNPTSDRLLIEPQAQTTDTEIGISRLVVYQWGKIA